MKYIIEIIEHYTKNNYLGELYGIETNYPSRPGQDRKNAIKLSLQLARYWKRHYSSILKQHYNAVKAIQIHADI